MALVGKHNSLKLLLLLLLLLLLVLLLLVLLLLFIRKRSCFDKHAGRIPLDAPTCSPYPV